MTLAALWEPFLSCPHCSSTDVEGAAEGGWFCYGCGHEGEHEEFVGP